MKHMVYGIALLAIAVMAVAGVMIVSGKDVRENEADKALNTAVEQTLEQLKKHGGYEIGNAWELIADFQQALLLHISSDADLEVEILTADTERGILDVKITETYRTMNDREKQAVCRKTVILEEYSDKRGYCMAEFRVDGTVYAKYSLYQGSEIVTPPKPQKAGRIFLGWRKAGGSGWLMDGMATEKDIAFEAVFE